MLHDAFKTPETYRNMLLVRSTMLPFTNMARLANRDACMADILLFVPSSLASSVDQVSHTLDVGFDAKIDVQKFRYRRNAKNVRLSTAGGHWKLAHRRGWWLLCKPLVLQGLFCAHATLWIQYHHP